MNSRDVDELPGQWGHEWWARGYGLGHTGRNELARECGWAEQAG